MEGNFHSQSESSDSEAEDVIGVLSHERIGRLWKYVRKAGGTNVKAAYELSSSDLLEAGLMSPAKRERVLQALKMLRSLKKLKNERKDWRKKWPSVLREISLHHGNERKRIKTVLKALGITELDTKAFVNRFPTIKSCKSLSHPILKSFGITLSAHRDKIIDAFKKFKASSSSSETDCRKSSFASSLCSTCSASSLSDDLLDSSKKSKRSRKRSSRLAYSSSRSSFSSPSLLLSSSRSGVGDKKKIMAVIKETGLKKAFDTKAFLEKFKTLEECKELTHEDLRVVGLSLFSQRDKLIEAFRDYNSTSSSPGSSSSSSDDKGVEKKKIMKVIKRTGVERTFDTKAFLKNFKTLKKCKHLTHEDLRALGLSLFSQRDKLIGAFCEYKSSSSESSEPSSSSDDEGAEKHKITKIIKRAGLKKAMDTKGFLKKFKTLKDCKELTHDNLRAVGLSLFSQRHRLIEAFREYKFSSSSLSSSDDEGGEKRKILKIIKGTGLKYTFDTNAFLKKFKTLKECKELTHDDLRAVGLRLFTQRHKLIEAFREYRSSSSSSSSSGLSSSGSSSSDDNEEGDEKKIMNTIRRTGLKKAFDTKAFLKTFKTLKECKKLTHGDLQAVGLRMFHQRDKLLVAFGQYKSCSSSSRSSSLSDDDGGDKKKIMSVIKETGLEKAIDTKAFLKKYKTLTRCKELAHYELQAVGIGEYFQCEKLIEAFREYKTSSSSGSDDVGGERRKVMMVIKETGLKRSFDTKAFLKKFKTLIECKGLTHDDLRAFGLGTISKRDKLIEAFREKNRPSSSGSSSSPSDDEEGDKKKIKKVIKDCGLNKAFDTKAFLKKFKTLKECKELTHEDLKAFGLSMFSPRYRLIEAFRDDLSISSSSSESSSSSSDNEGGDKKITV